MKYFGYANKKKSDYFEGWYLRIIDTSNHINMAIIVALTKNKKDPHSFLQVYDGTSKQNTYYRFPIGDFSYNNSQVHIGKNTLSTKQVVLMLPDITLNATITNHQVVQKNGRNISAMSYLRNAPLDCFQEVVLVNGTVAGTLVKNNNETPFSGSSYMEKTYGNKFPKKWIWIQSNQFEDDTTLSFSMGYVPVLFSYIKGFTCVLTHDHDTYLFSTYNFSRLQKIDENKEDVSIEIKKGKYKLIIQVKGQAFVELVGPSDKGLMNIPVFESLSSTVKVTLYKNKELLFSSTGTHVGYEKMDNLNNVLS